MKKPNLEQGLYIQLSVAEGLTQSIADNIPNSFVFDTPEIRESLNYINEHIAELRYLMSGAFATSEKPQKVSF